MEKTFICEECKKEFISNTRRKIKKYCSRDCYSKVDSRRKKEKFLTQDHHNLGRKASLEEREMRSKLTAETWKSESIREARISGIKKWKEEHNYAPGWDPDSIKKRNTTVELKGGHNFKGKFGTRQCDITCIERYGMTPRQLANKKLRNLKKSKPEIYAEKLLYQIDNNFIAQIKFKNRFFDFGLESEKLLIEIDGDYWHSKGIPYENMNEQQRTTFKNDRYKDDLVKNSDWNLVRIWVSDLEKLSAEDLYNIIYDKKSKD